MITTVRRSDRARVYSSQKSNRSCVTLRWPVVIRSVQDIERCCRSFGWLLPGVEDIVSRYRIITLRWYRDAAVVCCRCAQNEAAYHAVDGTDGLVDMDQRGGGKRAKKDRRVDLDNLKREVEMVGIISFLRLLDCYIISFQIIWIYFAVRCCRLYVSHTSLLYRN